MRWDVLGLAALGTGVLWVMHRRQRARIKAVRGAIFAELLPLFESYRVTQDDVDFPVLEGRYRDHDIRLEPIVDHVALRKLPSLWLRVTLRGPVPYRGVFDLLARPQNTEFFSPSAGLETAVALPPGWPTHATLRSDQPAAMPPPEIMQAHIDIFADPRTKELLVTPKGVRIVYQANQARRTQYLVLRQAEFDDLALSAELGRRLLDRVVALYQDLAGAPAGAGHPDEPGRAERRQVRPALAG